MTTDERIKKVEDMVASMKKDGWGMKDFSFLLALVKVQREALNDIASNNIITWCSACEYNEKVAVDALNWQPEDV